MAEITVTVDGVKYADHVEPRMLLVHYLREVVGKTGTPIGCDTSNCGACTVLLDGQSVKSCSVLAVQADGAEITTIQGLANGGLHPLQRAFHEEHAPGIQRPAAGGKADLPDHVTALRLGRLVGIPQGGAHKSAVYAVGDVVRRAPLAQVGQ